MFRRNEGWGDIKAHSESQQPATMMTGYSSPSPPSRDLSVDSDAPPIANIVTGSRKKRRKNVSAITPPQLGLGANHLDHSDQDGSHFASLQLEYWRLKCASRRNNYDASDTLAAIILLLPSTHPIKDDGSRTDKQQLNVAHQSLVRTRRNAKTL
jgi:hypothetical protein